jgi:hypothetical protein
MPPRRAAHLRGLPLTLVSTAESVEARVKRLRPQDQVSEGLPVVAACVGTSPWGVASSAAGVLAWSTEGLRADALVVRNVRRGSFLLAADTLASSGSGMLIDELVRDKHARSSAASISSWLATWSRFQHLAFADCLPPIPLYPITPCTLLHIAALFSPVDTVAFQNTYPLQRLLTLRQALRGITSWLIRAPGYHGASSVVLARRDRAAALTTRAFVPWIGLMHLLWLVARTLRFTWFCWLASSYSARLRCPTLCGALGYQPGDF